MSVASITGLSWSVLPELSCEIRAMLTCARAVLDRSNIRVFQAALSTCASSVDALSKAAVAHGMLGHLHEMVVTGEAVEIDSDLTHRLGKLQRAATVRGLLQTAFLLGLLQGLQAAGIRAMPIKGPAWAQSLYGDIAMRTWSDLDLLLVHDDVTAARKHLIAEGFVDANPFNERITRRSKGSLGQVALSHQRANVHIELHWEVTVGISPRALRPETVFARAESLELLGRPVLCPSRSDMVLITCLEGSRDRWDTVEKLLGLGVQIQRLRAEDWPPLLATARDVGCLRRVCVGVDHVCRVLGLERVPAVHEVLARDWVGRSLVEGLKANLLSRGGGSGPGRELAHICGSSPAKIGLRQVWGMRFAGYSSLGPKTGRPTPSPPALNGSTVLCAPPVWLSSGSVAF